MAKKSATKSSSRNRKQKAQRQPDIFDAAIAAHQSQESAPVPSTDAPSAGRKTAQVFYTSLPYPAQIITTASLSAELQALFQPTLLCKTGHVPLGSHVPDYAAMRSLCRVRPCVRVNHPGGAPVLGLLCELDRQDSDLGAQGLLIFVPFCFDPITGTPIEVVSSKEPVVVRENAAADVPALEVPISASEDAALELSDEELEAMRNDDEPSGLVVAEDVVADIEQPDPQETAKDFVNDLEFRDDEYTEEDESEESGSVLADEPLEEAVEEEESVFAEEGEEEEIRVDLVNDSTERLHEVCVYLGLVSPKVKVSRETLIKLLSDYDAAQDEE